MMEVKESEIINSIELKNAVVYLLDGDIIGVKAKEHSVIDLEDVKEVNRAKRELIGNKKHFVLIVTPKDGSITKEAREFSASEEVNLNAIAKAIVMNGLAMRIIVNFFINYDKPPVPHKAFETERDALDWLKKIRASLKGA